MSKPLGMTAAFQIVRPTRTEDKIWDAVEEAIAAGWTPQQFVSEARESWRTALQDRVKDADKEFERMTR
jgi:hypothetical protein